MIMRYGGFSLRNIGNNMFAVVLINFRWRYLLKKERKRLMRRPKYAYVLKKRRGQIFKFNFLFRIIFFLLMPLVEYFRMYIMYILNQHFIFKSSQIHFLIVKRRPSAQGILNELILRFRLTISRIKRYNYRRVLSLMIRKLSYLLKRKRLNGFKIAFTGRFTRRERLTYK